MCVSSYGSASGPVPGTGFVRGVGMITFVGPRRQRGFVHEAIIGGLFSAYGARKQQKFDAAQAQKQMSFQERMSSTAHQREVLDLRAAGLNPILSATGGRGASAPGGARAVGQNIIGQGVSSALGVRRLKQELRNMKMTEWEAQARIGLMAAQRAKVLEEHTGVGIANQAASYRLPGQRTEAIIDNTEYGQVVRFFGRLNPLGSSAASWLKGIK